MLSGSILLPPAAILQSDYPDRTYARGLLSFYSCYSQSRIKWPYCAYGLLNNFSSENFGDQSPGRSKLWRTCQECSGMRQQAWDVSESMTWCQSGGPMLSAHWPETGCWLHLCSTAALMPTFLRHGQSRRFCQCCRTELLLSWTMPRSIHLSGFKRRLKRLAAS